ncbi:MAG: hypothetical protein SWX82_06040 [Cyanobacteriota bacterium]|nr:hypothetical protein [Cyanobacteriota bacterium]
MTYKTQAADTTIEADKKYFDLLGKVSIETKIKQYITTNRKVKSIQWQLLKTRFPELDKNQLKQKYITIILGEKFAQISELINIEFMINDPVDIAIKIGKILDNLNILYFVGGGLASSFWGEPRQTNDADIIVSLTTNDIKKLITAFEREFYISDTAVEDAIQGKANSFNVIHTASVIKADIHPINFSNLFEKISLSRRQKIYPLDSSEQYFYVASPEDIILHKLIWYRIADNQSAKQWRDILGVLKAQGKKLDFNYLKHWQNELKISSDLQRAFDESGTSKND